MLLIVLVLLYSSVKAQDNSKCVFSFDFGYGDEPYCDSSLIKAGYFNYNSISGLKLKIEQKIFISGAYEDSDLNISFAGRIIYLTNKRQFGSIQRFNLATYYNKGFSADTTEEVELYNGYKFKYKGLSFYLFYIIPPVGHSSKIPFRGIIFDLSTKNIKIITFPSWQTSNSFSCLGLVTGPNELNYISFNVYSHSTPQVLLYRYENGKFVKDKRFHLALDDVDGFLYKIDWNNSKWPCQ